MTIEAIEGGYTVTRTTGSWLTDGFAVGRQVLITGQTAGKSWLVSEVTADVLTLEGTATISGGLTDVSKTLTSTGGIAGYASGNVNANIGPVEGGARVLVRLNKTGGGVDQSIQIGTRTVEVKFAANEGNVFEVSLSDLTLNIGDFISVEGNVSFANGNFAGTGLKVFLGQGPATLGNGELNPLATGVLISNARIGVVQRGAGYAVVATGTVSLVGIDGLTISGTVSVRVNTTGLTIDETICDRRQQRSAGRGPLRDR